MKLFKKALLALVVCLMFVTASLTFNNNTILAEDDELIELPDGELNDVPLLGDSFYYHRATEIYNLSLENKTFHFNTQINNSSSSGSALSVFKYIGVGLQFLKYLGMMMDIIPDEDAENEKYVISRFDAIDEKLRSIEGDLNQIYDTLTKQFQQIDKNLKVLDIGQKKSAISDFYDRYTSNLLKYVNNYNTGIRGQLKNWYESRTLEEFKEYLGIYDDAFKITFREKDYNGNQVKVVNKTVELSASAMFDRLQIYRERHSWTNDCQQPVNFLYDYAESSILDPLIFEKNDNPSLVEWLKYAIILNGRQVAKNADARLMFRILQFIKNSDGNKFEQLKTKFVDGVFDTIVAAGTKNYAEFGQGTPENFVGTLTGLFKDYCNYLNDNNAQSFKNNSAYRNTLDIYKTIFNFQKELDCSVEFDKKDAQGRDAGKIRVDTNAAKLSLDKYIYELSNLGNFVAMMATNSGVFDEQQLIDEIYLPWAETEQKLLKMYNDFYKKDAPYYCYPLGKEIELKTGELKGTIYASKELSDGGIIQDDFISSGKVNYTFSYRNADLLGDTAIRMIYGTYLARGGNAKGFYDYLNEMFGYDKNNRYSQFLITKFTGTESITRDDTFDMKCSTMSYRDIECPDKWLYHNADSVRVAYDDGKNKEFKYLQTSMKAIASTFDMVNIKSDLKTTLNAMAVGNDNCTNKDEMGILYANNIYNSDGYQTNLNGSSYDVKMQTGYDRWKNNTIPQYQIRYDSSVTNTGRFYVLVPKGTKEATKVSLGTFGSRNLLNSLNNPTGKETIEAFDKDFASNTKGEYEPNYKFNAEKEVGNIDELPYMINYEFANEDIAVLEDDLISYLDVDDNVKEMADDYYGHIVMLEKAGQTEKIMDISKDDYLKAINKMFGEDCQVVSNIRYATKPDPKLFAEDTYLAYDYGKDVFYKLNRAYNWQKLTKEETDLIVEDLGGDIPDNSCDNFELVYDNNPKLVYNFFQDEKGDIDYALRCIYDIQPKLVWDDADGKQHSLNINDDAIAALDFESVEITLPVYQKPNDDTITVLHYSNMDNIGCISSVNTKDGTFELTKSQIEELTGKVYKTKDGNFAKVSVTSFSPFEIVYTGIHVKPEQKKQQPGYVIPKTGVK